MFYHVAICSAYVRKNWRGKEVEEYIPSIGCTMHESEVDEWVKARKKDIASKYHGTIVYRVEKLPVRLTMRQAFDLYPEDFKLWCEENGFTGMLDAFRDAIK